MFLRNIDGRLQTDVAIIGAGGAGLRAAMAAKDKNADVIVTCKGRFARTGSTFFPLVPGWGIQFLSEDRKNGNTREYFLKEILEVGEHMAIPGLARLVVEQTPQRVYELEQMGIVFEKDKEGKFYDYLCCFADVKRPGAIAFDLDNIRSVFRKEVEKRDIKVIENFDVIKILTCEVEGKRRVVGLVGLDSKGDLHLIKSKSVILATGGACTIFKHNMNSPELTGDGYRLALDAGASLMNMEYVQYIYGIVAPRKMHFIEKVLSFSPPILNRVHREFLGKYAVPGISFNDILQKRMEHGPFTSRLISKYFDIAIFSEIRGGMGTANYAVYVDLRNLWAHIDKIEKEFPATKKWYSWLKGKGIDPDVELIEIALCAHANNGGVYVDEDAMSEVNGLFACGEVMGGPHGADRQGGNMMAATQVFGKIAGDNAATFSRQFGYATVRDRDVLDELNYCIRVAENGSIPFTELRDKIQEITNRELVMCRKEEGLREVSKLMDTLEEEYLPFLRVSHSHDMKNYFSLKSMIVATEAIAEAALLRKESRGSHHREDHPEKDDSSYGRPIRIMAKDGKLTVELMRKEFS